MQTLSIGSLPMREETPREQPSRGVCILPISVGFAACGVRLSNYQNPRAEACATKSASHRETVRLL